MIKQIIRFIGSVRFTVILLITFAVVLISATWLATDTTNGAYRKDFYRSWQFVLLLTLLTLNILCATVKKMPFKIWQIGFVMTHIGIIIILSAAMVSGLFKTYGYMTLQEGKISNYIELEDEHQIAVQVEKGDRGVVSVDTFDLDTNIYNPAPLNKVFLLKGTGKILTVEKFIPNADSATYIDNTSVRSNPAVEVTIKSSVSSEQSGWLFQNEPISYSGLLNLYLEVVSADRLSELERTISYDSVEASYKFIDNINSKGTLNVKVDGVGSDIDVSNSLGKDIKIGSRILTLRKFFPHLVITENGYENQSDKPENPAVLFDMINADNKITQYIVFALYPDISPMRLGEGGSIHMEKKESAIRILITNDGLKYLIQSKNGEKKIGNVELGKFYDYVWTPMNMQFSVNKFYEKAEKKTQISQIPDEQDMPRRPAVYVSLQPTIDKLGSWIHYNGAPAVFEEDDYKFTVQFTSKKLFLDFVMYLERFNVPIYPGTDRASLYESYIKIKDGEDIITRKIGVNYPVTYKGFTFYQNSAPARDISVLAVSKDPGQVIFYIGFVVLSSGILALFYLKPILKKKFRKEYINAEIGKV